MTSPHGPGLRQVLAILAATTSVGAIRVALGVGGAIPAQIGLAADALAAAAAVGQSAEVAVASTDQVLTGVVSSIGILDVSESLTPAYTVVVTLDPTDEPLFGGASARVTITVSGDEATLTVPTSAVHVDVETGAVGDERTEILSGLAEGDEVVLADLSEPLTEDEGTTTTGLSGLGGDSDERSVVIGGSVPGGMVPPSFDRDGGWRHRPDDPGGRWLALGESQPSAHPRRIPRPRRPQGPRRVLGRLASLAVRPLERREGDGTCRSDVAHRASRRPPR